MNDAKATHEPTVQDIRRKNALVGWYETEAHKLHAENKTNKIGIAFWLLMAQQTERKG